MRARLGVWVGWGLLALGLFSMARAEESVTLVLGDSLSAAYGIPSDSGWVTLLEHKLTHTEATPRLVNSSISGETTAGGLARLPALLKTLNPEAVLVFLGGNDGLRGIDPDVTRAHLHAMASLSQAAGAEVGFIPVRLPANYGKPYIAAFEALYAEVCRTASADCIAFPWEEIGLNSRYMQPDGLHPNAEAQPIILERLWPALCAWRHWPECASPP